MIRRGLLFAGPTVMVLASTTAGVAIGAPTLSSPILDAAGFASQHPALARSSLIATL